MKKYLPLLLVLLLAVFILTRPDCQVKGPEYETLIVDGTVYEISRHDDLSIADKGAFLSLYYDGRTLFRIYRAENDPDYLYVAHGWEGEFYKRQ